MNFTVLLCAFTYVNAGLLKFKNTKQETGTAGTFINGSYQWTKFTAPT